MYEVSPGKRLLAFLPNQENRVRGQAMDALIERELLAHAAEKMGFTVSEIEVADMITEDRALIGGIRFPLKPGPEEKNQEGIGFVNGKLDYSRLERILKNIGLTVKQFFDMQARELLAQKLRQFMQTSTKVSPEEVKQAFAQKNTKLKLEYVRFSPYDFTDTILPKDDVLASYAQAHEAELKKTYEDRKGMYQKQERQIRLYRISIPLAKDAKEEEVKETQHILDEALSKIRQGTPFTEVAKSIPQNQQGRGGNMGWVKQGSSGLAKEVEEEVFKQTGLEQLSAFVGPLRTETTMELIQRGGVREGEISFEQAKLELAEEKYRQETANALMKQSAQTAFAEAQAGKKLADLYPKLDPETKRDPNKPSVHVEETEFFEKQGEEIQGIGSSKELAKILFSKKVGDVVGPTEVRGSQVVIVVKEKKEPDWKEFEAQKETLTGTLRQEKAAQTIARFSLEACKEADGSGNISVNPALFKQEAPPTPSQGSNPDLENFLSQGTYKPCQPMKNAFPFSL